MQETLKKVTGSATESVQKSVTLCLQSQVIVLNGFWKWEMQSTAVYCSDVMAFPENFEGTKAIIHPDDIPQLTSTLKLIRNDELTNFEFRIITTYGEVKTISGKNISIDNSSEKIKNLFPGKETWEEALEHLTEKKQNDFLQLRFVLTEITERFHNIGSYLLNKTNLQAWYSDNVFRIYKLAPQGLNAHAHTFNQFIHADDREAVLDAFEKTFRDELPFEIEYRIVLPDGETKFVQHITRWVFDAKGHLLCCGIIRDISSERAIADELLKAQANTSLYQQLLKFSEQQSDVAYWYVNLVTRKAFYSDNYWRIFGVKQSNHFNLQSFLKLVHVDDREIIKTLYEKMYAEYVMPDSQFRIIRPDGKTRYLRQNGRFLVDPNKEPVMIGVVRDITAQRKLEIKISDLNESVNLNKLIEEATETIYDVTSIIWHNGSLNASEGFLRMSGIKSGTNEDLLKTIDKIIYPDDKKIWKEIATALTQHQTPADVVVRVISKTGIKSLKISFVQLDDEKKIIVGLIQDVTAQTLLQQKLTENKLFSDLLLNSVNDIIVFTNTDHTITSWNEKAEQKIGIKKENALYQNLFDVLPALNNDQFISQLKSVLSGEEAHSLLADTGYLSKPYQYWLLPLKDEEANVIGALHVIHDISRQIQLQSQLHERLNFIENLVESSVDRIVVLDREMNYLYWNQKAEEYYGIEKERIIGKNILEIFPAFRNIPGYHEFRKVLKGETIFIPTSESAEDKEYVETYLTPIKDENGNVTSVLWIVHDLSGEFELQKGKRIADEKIREQARYLQRITETTPDMISIMELGTRNLTFLNVQTFKANGFDPDEMTNAPHEENRLIVHPEDRRALDDYFQSFVNAADDSIVTAEYRAITKSGEWNWFMVRGKVFQRDENDKVTHILNVIENITAYKKTEQNLRESQELMQTVLSTALHSFSVLQPVRDSNGKVIDFKWLFANKEVQRRTSKELIGSSFVEVYPGIENTVWMKRYAEVVDTGVEINFEDSFLIDGIENWFHVIAQKHKENLIVTSLNITDYKRSEKELIESRHWLEQTAQASPDSISVYDLQKRVPVYLNTCFGEWIGIRNKDLIEMGAEGRLKLIHPDDRLNVLQFNKKIAAANDGQILTLEYRIKTSDDKMLWIRNRSKIFMRNDTGAVTHLLSILQNVTEEIELREELKRRSQFAETILDASTNRVTVFDRNYRFITWNKRCEEIHGVSRDKVIGKTIFEMFPGVENHPVFINAQEQSLKGEYVHVPSVQDTYTGAYLELFYVPLKNEWGETYAVLNIMHDVSTYVKQTEALNILNKKLESQNAELEQKNEEITHFSFVASHDMKEPLRKIHTFSDWLLEQESNQLSPKGKNLVEKINSSVKRMNLLIEDILVLTKIHSDTHREENVDLNNVLQKVVDDSSDKIRQTQTEVRSERLPVIKGNENQLFYLFKNLIANAIKFQKPGNVPHIKITAEVISANEIKLHEGVDAFLKLCFIDNGFGFDSRYVKKIFQVFQRLHGKQEYEGTGIGLAICKKIMENHGGMITAETEEGKGSTFSCYFPLQ